MRPRWSGGLGDRGKLHAQWDETRSDSDAKKATRKKFDEITRLSAKIDDLGRRVQGDSAAAAALAEGLRDYARAPLRPIRPHVPSRLIRLISQRSIGTKQSSELTKLEMTDPERTAESELDVQSEQSDSHVTTSRNANGASAIALIGYVHRASKNWVLWFPTFQPNSQNRSPRGRLERRHSVAGEVGISQLAPRPARPLHPNEPTFMGPDALVRVGPGSDILCHPWQWLGQASGSRPRGSDHS